MSNEIAPRPAMTVLFTLLLIFAAFLATWVTALAADFHGSDAAGNGMAQGFAFLGAILFWIAAGVLLVLCGVRAGFSAVRVLAAIVALAVAVTSHFMAMSILQNMQSGDRFETVLAVMIGALQLVVLLCTLWAFFPGLRSAVPPMAASVGAGVVLLVVCAIPWLVMGPAQATEQARMDAYQAERDRDAAQVKQIEALPADTPLAGFLKYTDIPPEKDTDARRAALDRMKALPGRQAAVEELLARQDTRVLRQLSQLEVKMTPKLCAGGKQTALRVAAELKPSAAQPTYDSIETRMSTHMDGIDWLQENGCDCKDVYAAFEQTLRLYPESYPRKWAIDHLLEKQGKPRQP